MPVMRRETEPDKGLLLYNEHGAEHYPLHEAVHREVLDLGSGKCRSLHPMRYDKGCRIQEQPERVGSERAARHSVCAEVFQVLDPQFHCAASAISPVDGLGFVVAVARDYETHIDALGSHLDLGYHPLLVFP